MTKTPFVRLLEPVLMTAESFAPYGEVLDAPRRPQGRREMVPSRFVHDGRVTASVIWQPQAGTRFSRLERHFGITQTFAQLAGPRSVVCVARPTNIDDPLAVPPPEEVRAFLIDPAVGWSFSVGTWHSLDRFVLGSPGATFLIVNVAPNPTQIVDYIDGSSTVFEDLDVDPKPRWHQQKGLGGVAFEVAAPG